MNSGKIFPFEKYFVCKGDGEPGGEGGGQQVVPAPGLGLRHLRPGAGRAEGAAADHQVSDRGAVQHQGEGDGDVCSNSDVDFALAAADGDHEPRLGVGAAGLHPDRHPRRLLLFHRRAHRRPVDQPCKVGVTYRRTVRSYK